MAWHVLVTWPDGRKERIEDFATKKDAMLWVDVKAADWLAIQIGDGR